MDNARGETLLSVARARAREYPRRGYRFLAADLSVCDSLTYAQLDVQARRIAAALQSRGVAARERVLLLYEPGLHFVRAFWGCVYAGAVAVPVPPPLSSRASRTLPRLRAIVRDCSAAVLLTTRALRDSAHLEQLSPDLGRCLLLESDALDGDGSWQPPASVDASDVALLQYTSGSTREPRGVVISHRNLLHNLQMLREFHQRQSHMVLVHWLPLYHDMGLIRGMLSPLHMGGDCYMMSPLTFVRKPARWLAAVTRYGGTTIGAPNFGYQLCVDRVTDEQRAALDLSSVQIAFCSAEPIRAATVARFVADFSPCGLAPRAFRPSYGLAEATVFVVGETSAHYRTWRVDAEALRDGRAVTVGSDEAGGDSDSSYEMVCCGAPLGGQQLAIVDERGAPCAPGVIGEIWVSGESVAQGYWRRPELSAEVFGAQRAGAGGRWLRTGDLGCVGTDGELYVTGRRDDMIIVRGLNYYPHDIEVTVEAASPHLRRGCSAVFAVDDEHGSCDVAVMCEARAAAPADVWPSQVEAICAAVSQRHGLSLRGICVVAAGNTPKTASGKVQRSRARALCLAGSVPIVHRWRARRALTGPS